MITIKIKERAGSFAEDKDIAAKIRESEIMPALKKSYKVRLDFSGVDGATQSFIHALISNLIRSMGANILDDIEFKNCNATVKSVVEIVSEYSQLTD
jgi:hypothetical protein